MSDSALWFIISFLALILALGVLVPEIYGRSTRRKEKKLSFRAKRRIEL